MPDPISAAAGIIGLAQTLGNLLGKIKDKSVRDQLQESIFRIREEALRLQEENAGLRDENRRLKERASERVNPADYKLEKNAYWKDGLPHCLRCMEGDRKARTLIQRYEISSTGFCPACNAQFNGVFPEQLEPPPPPLQTQETETDDDFPG